MRATSSVPIAASISQPLRPKRLRPNSNDGTDHKSVVAFHHDVYVRVPRPSSAWAGVFDGSGGSYARDYSDGPELGLTLCLFDVQPKPSQHDRDRDERYSQPSTAMIALQHGLFTSLQVL